MKLRQAIAGMLTGVMIVANVPIFGEGGHNLSAKAEEAKAASDEGPVRYRAVPGSSMKVSADGRWREDAPLDNIKSDAANYALTRYNTGGTPRSSQLEARNKIYLKLSEAANVKNILWWADEDKTSDGHGWNVHNGTLTRCRISVTTEANVADAEEMGSLEESKWKVQQGETGDVRFWSNTDDNVEHKYCEHTDGQECTLNVAHMIDLTEHFENLPDSITGVRIEVLNTAGDYIMKGEERKDERDTYINGREVWVMTGAEKENKLAGVTAYTDFETESGCGADKLVDGVIAKTSKMNSLLNPAAGETKDNGVSPWKHDYGKYFANNNIYIDIGETKQLGKLTYVPGTQNGSIERCNIYTSNASVSAPEEITDEQWELAYSNVPGTDLDGNPIEAEGWAEYNAGLGTVGNAKEAPFITFKNARFVRMEVINTQGSGTRNKWINIGRVYVYEAETVYTGEVRNVALASSGTTVQSYTGYVVDGANKQNHLSPDKPINDSGNNESDTPNYWVGTVPLRDENKNLFDDDRLNYMVLDLGENTTVDLERIAVRWHRKAWAAEYRIETCATPPSPAGNVNQDTINIITEDTLEEQGGDWIKVAEYPGQKENPRDREAGNTIMFPLDEFSGDELQAKTLERYVRIVIKKGEKESGYDSPGLRALELWGIRQIKEVSDVGLDLDEEPVYAGVMRAPSTPVGADYHLEDYAWYKENSETAEKDRFGAGTYVLKAKVASKFEFSTLAEATIGGADAEIKDLNETNSAGENLCEVSRSYTIEDPTDAKTDLQALIEKNEIKTAFETDNKDADNGNALIYRIEGWNIFKDAYIAAKSMIEMKTEGDQADAVWYLKSEYIAAKVKLQNAFDGLIRRGSGDIVDTDEDTPDVTVTPPVAGEVPADARLSEGKIENDNVALVRERDHSKPYFHVDADKYMYGRVKAPNDDPLNELFDFKGTTKFMVKCTVRIPERVTKKETIVGRLKGWGLQILPKGHKNNSSGSQNEQLIAFAYSSDSVWPQATFNIPDEGWYGTADHDIVAVFNGGYFQLYVDGERASYRTSPNNQPLSGPLTMNYNTSTFCVNYNENPEVAGNMEDFSGGMKDFELYVDKPCLNDLESLDDASDSENNKKELFTNALNTLLNGTEPDVTLTGEPANYDVSRTVWEVWENGQAVAMPKESAFERYRDYKVTVDVRTTAGYQFSSPKGILKNTAGEVLTETPEETEEEVLVRLSYIFTSGEKHPKETLMEYLEGVADELGVRVENETLVNKDKETGNKKYTTAGWNAFVPVYNAAVEQAGQDKLWGEENNSESFSSALTNLQNEVETLKTKTADGRCECVIESIAFEGGNISLDEASAEIALNAACTVNNADCLKHTGDGKVDALITYTCEEENGAGASIEGNKLTVTKEGSVTVTARAEIKDGTQTVSETTAEAVFTAASTPADTDDKNDLDQAIQNIETIISGLKESDYTPESWQTLMSKLEDAKTTLEALKDMLAGSGDQTVNKNLVASIIEGLKADQILVKKEDPAAKAKENLQKALKAADAVYAAGSKDYADAAWKAFEAAYKAAKAAPANASAETLKKLTDALVSAQAGLNRAVVSGDTRTVDGMLYRVTNAGSKTVMLVTGKEAKNVTVPASITIKGASYNVTAIGDQAFAGKGKIQKVTIGLNVTSIGKKAFFKCKKLKNVIFKGTKVKTVKGKAFSKTASKVKVKLPKKLKGKQRASLLKKLKKAGMKIK